MSRRRTVTSGSLIILMLSAVASAAADRLPGYLADGEFDVTHILEPAPRAGDPRYDTDRKIFRATRGFEGSPRWALAVSDADERTESILKDFS